MRHSVHSLPECGVKQRHVHIMRYASVVRTWTIPTTSSVMFCSMAFMTRTYAARRWGHLTSWLSQLMT